MKKSIVILFFIVCNVISFAQPLVKTDTLISKDENRLSVAQMLAKLPNSRGDWFERGISHGSLNVYIYAPKRKDTQTPHQQDEVYVIVRGSGIFFDGFKRYPFAKGDVLFVPAKVTHCFEKFTKDFVSWVIFYGPVGGEK